MVTEVENVKSSPAPEPVTDIADEDHVENINIIFIGHVGKYKFFFFFLFLFFQSGINYQIRKNDHNLAIQDICDHV